MLAMPARLGIYNVSGKDAETSPEEWRRFYQRAVREVADLNPEQQLEEAKKTEADNRRQLERLAAKLEYREEQEREERLRSERIRTTGGLLEEIIRSMWNPFDFVFTLLAVISAFGIASKGPHAFEDVFADG